MTWRLALTLSLLPTVLCADRFTERVLPMIDSYCLTCHDGEIKKRGLDLERFASLDEVFADRQVWAEVYEKVESRQMPPPKRRSLPTAEEREEVLRWIEEMAALPDPGLGARDPGKPVLRRLNRLEYNNTVRDLFGLDIDIFLFTERLPILEGRFDVSARTLPRHIRVNVREYGSKAPALLPSAGLPAENRAAHGYNNRGDAMNVSPLLLEKYVSLADQIVNEPSLPSRSPYFASLLGVDPSNLPRPAKSGNSVGVVTSKPVISTNAYAPNNNAASHEESDLTLEAFRKALETARELRTAGAFDVPDSLANTTVAGKGGLIRISFGEGSQKQLTINPNADLWLVPFATAEETSGEFLVANKEKGEKTYELTFEIKNGNADERLTQVACCLLSRRGQFGTIVLTATFHDKTTATKTMTVNEDSGNLFVGFRAPDGKGIHRLRVDGSRFGGDYVLLDDIGFITNGKAASTRELPAGDLPLEELEPVEFASLEGSPRERLQNFLARAFRRPSSDSDVEHFFQIFQRAKDDGTSEADAMRQTASAVLSSASFVFLREEASGEAGETAVRALTDHELATRLSYFLWSSMPDEELRQLADQGRLTDPAVREDQVRSMLRDPKARELSESFAVQWLRLDQLYTAKPDRELFPDFYRGPQGKSTLHASMLVEALLLFETIMLEDRSVLELIDADYTWLNPRLISHYGLDDAAEPLLAALVDDDGASVRNAGNRELPPESAIEDNQWFRVPLPDKTRGGVITMAGPLTVTSLPFRTSPIKRGAWLLETVFNRPPSEPKVAFAIEDDTKEAALKQSVRERFEAHRNKPACYSCHVRLDPPGFALEHFDPTGRWRDRDGSVPVDARAEWNGQPFNGPSAFKKLVSDDPHEFTRGFIEHLLSYALGRKLGIQDMPTVQTIQKRAESDGWRFSRIIVEIAGSYPFTHTR